MNSGEQLAIQQKIAEVYYDEISRLQLHDRPVFQLNGPVQLHINKSGIYSVQNFIGEEQFILLKAYVAGNMIYFRFSELRHVLGRDLPRPIPMVEIDVDLALNVFTGLNKYLGHVWDKHNDKQQKEIRKEVKRLEKEARKDALKERRDDPIFGSW